MSKEIFSYVKLKDVADVEISSVDKKCNENETEVSLCNFVDVYYNWAITEGKADSFMKATAKQSEIDRFALKKGQVAITKDSETKYDIGVATYIADDFDNVLLGYHCALITPNENKLSGKYLNAFFHTKFVQKYFELNATGSGQRFTLSLDAIKDMPIYLPSLSKQKEVAEIFSKIDRKIEMNETINDNLEQQIRLLYEFWFVQFDFPDSKGNPYRLSNGKMQWNDDLKTLIPEEWHCKKIIELASIDNESLNPSNFGTQLMEHYSIPAFDETHCPRFECANTIESNKYIVNSKAILVSKLNPQFKRIWDPFCETKNAICSTEFISYVPHKEKERSFLYAVLDSDAFYTHSVQRATSSTGSRKRIQPEVSASFKFAYPNDESIINAFCDLCTPILKKKKDLLKENQDLRALKDWLLPFIMNGQFSISD